MTAQQRGTDFGGTRPAVTGDQWHRMLTLVALAYTVDYVTPGGIVKRRPASRVQQSALEARAVVAFMVDHVIGGYLAPAGLWDDLFTFLLEDGTLVRDPNGAVRHRADRRPTITTTGGNP